MPSDLSTSTCCRDWRCRSNQLLPHLPHRQRQHVGPRSAGHSAVAGDPSRDERTSGCAYKMGFVPGELVHVISDAHIYDRHVEIVKELITRPQFDAPKVTLNPEIKNFYDFKVADITVENYETNPQIKNIPIAV